MVLSYWLPHSGLFRGPALQYLYDTGHTTSDPERLLHDVGDQHGHGLQSPYARSTAPWKRLVQMNIRTYGQPLILVYILG